MRSLNFTKHAKNVAKRFLDHSDEIVQTYVIVKHVRCSNKHGSIIFPREIFRLSIRFAADNGIGAIFDLLTHPIPVRRKRHTVPEIPDSRDHFAGACTNSGSSRCWPPTTRGPASVFVSTIPPWSRMPTRSSTSSIASRTRRSIKRAWLPTDAGTGSFRPRSRLAGCSRIGSSSRRTPITTRSGGATNCGRKGGRYL